MFKAYGYRFDEDYCNKLDEFLNNNLTENDILYRFIHKSSFKWG